MNQKMFKKLLNLTNQEKKYKMFIDDSCGKFNPNYQTFKTPLVEKRYKYPSLQSSKSKPFSIFNKENNLFEMDKIPYQNKLNQILNNKNQNSISQSKRKFMVLNNKINNQSIKSPNQRFHKLLVKIYFQIKKFRKMKKIV